VMPVLYLIRKSPIWLSTQQLYRDSLFFVALFHPAQNSGKKD
jgi:hypothetical protein